MSSRDSAYDERPIISIDRHDPYPGTVSYLTWGRTGPEFFRARIRIPENATREQAADILRQVADQIQSGSGPEIREGETLFED